MITQESISNDNAEKSNIQQLEKIGAISGILSVLFYLIAATISGIPDYIGRLLAFVFPLLWIISFMGLYSFLKREKHTPTLEISYIFGIIGATLACVFLVIQQANFVWHDIAIESSKTDEASLLAIFKGVNRVQLGIDVAFDIFISISWFLFGLNIAKHHIARKILGWITCIITTGLLMMNMITFPIPPEDAGLLDFGPLLGIWVLVIYIWFTVTLFNNKI